MKNILLFGLSLVFAGQLVADESAWKPLFNGHDLSGWADVNTSPETWWVEDGELRCKGLPIGVMRSAQQYENFILEIEWMHETAGGNSGVFIWSEGTPYPEKTLPKGVEVQMLENEFYKIHNRVRGYVSGELFGSMGLEVVPDNPRGARSMSTEYRCKGKGEWNKYVVVAVDGVVKLSINGKFVNGIRESARKKGYLCLESEGAPVRFRNIRIMELPSGGASGDEIAAMVE
ncbi:MAG: DUF1080 domain-containing protein [Opitutaceae bacterium]|mgnify:CR=1